MLKKTKLLGVYSKMGVKKREVQIQEFNRRAKSDGNFLKTSKKSCRGKKRSIEVSEIPKKGEKSKEHGSFPGDVQLSSRGTDPPRKETGRGLREVE